MFNYLIVNTADSHLFKQIQRYINNQDNVKIAKKIIDVDGSGLVCYKYNNKDLYLIQDLFADYIIIRSEEDISDMVNSIRDYIQT